MERETANKGHIGRNTYSDERALTLIEVVVACVVCALLLGTAFWISRNLLVTVRYKSRQCFLAKKTAELLSAFKKDLTGAMTIEGLEGTFSGAAGMISFAVPEDAPGGSGPGAASIVSYRVSGTGGHRTVVRTQVPGSSAGGANARELMEGPVRLELSYLGDDGWQASWEDDILPLCVKAELVVEESNGNEQRFSRTVLIPQRVLQ